MARKAKKNSSSEKHSRTCAVMEHHNYLAKTDETYQRNRREIERFSSTARLTPRTSIIRIPVVVHVLFNDDDENLSEAQINSQIAALNRDFRARNDDIGNVPAPFKPFVADPLIEFGLAVRDQNGNPTTGRQCCSEPSNRTGTNRS